jgi:hypothetical protein
MKARWLGLDTHAQREGDETLILYIVTFVIGLGLGVFHGKLSRFVTCTRPSIHHRCKRGSSWLPRADHAEGRLGSYRYGRGDP